VRVPWDVSVTGFDGMDIDTYPASALTTVMLPAIAQRRAAAQTLLDMINKKAVPPVQSFPTVLVVRESCGCFAQSRELLNPQTGGNRTGAKRESPAGVTGSEHATGDNGSLLEDTVFRYLSLAAVDTGTPVLRDVVKRMVRNFF
jgi:hypothetical protein